ncbi:hypothetical protein ACS5PN_23715 [Roseateles sp. NT4]|uniref:hypothetical protein n=1 Tax=Roseateles sp. NT4 TaxID=3453715 RepID=UPI003EED8A9B
MKLRLVSLLLALAPALCWAAAPDCVSSPQIALDKIEAKIIVVGELRGTEQAPAFVGQLACGLLKLNRPVIVALERHGSEQEALNRYLASTGQTADVQALLSAMARTQPPQNSRNSQALLKLIEQLRQWRQTGQPVGVLAMLGSHQPVAPLEGLQRRSLTVDELYRLNALSDRGMADSVWIASVVHSGYTVVALAGDVQAAVGSKARAQFMATPSFADVLSGYAPIHVIGLTSGRSQMFMADSRIDSRVELDEITASPPAGSN